MVNWKKICNDALTMIFGLQWLKIYDGQKHCGRPYFRDDAERFHHLSASGAFGIGFTIMTCNQSPRKW
jgi:hypothetical protein